MLERTSIAPLPARRYVDPIFCEKRDLAQTLPKRRSQPVQPSQAGFTSKISLKYH